MMWKAQSHFLYLVMALIPVSQAAALVVKTPSPVIHLAHNLDEKDNLGWCIDTVGRGFGDRLHAHSCKPMGGDVQFLFDKQTGQIRSATFDDYCMAHRPDDKTTFALEPCDDGFAEQMFTYNPTSQQISPADNSLSCVIVGQQSQSAGPFMSRELALADCEDAESMYKQWVIVN